MALADDLAVIFADTTATVPVVSGAQSTRGIPSGLDVAESDGLGGVVIVRRQSVIVQDTALTGLADDQTVVVDGVTYTIHGVRSAGRGKTRILLA